MKNNPIKSMLSVIMRADSYKYSHAPSQDETQFPPGITHLESYGEHRVGSKYKSTVWAGLQYTLKEYFSDPITKQHVDYAANFMNAHGEPFNYEGWMEIVDRFNGYLPVRIKTLDEGSVVPTSNILYKVEEVDKRFFWLPQFLETMLQRGTWYPSTTATKGWYMKQVALRHLLKSSDNAMSCIDYNVHDFGGRGVTCAEQAMIGGMAHLVNFRGSDTIEGIWMANEYYNHKMAGTSIPAMEHATVCSWGRAREFEAYENFINIHKKRGYKMMAAVSDAYNVFDAVEHGWCEHLLPLVKDNGIKLVIRPDSGDPIDVNLKLLDIIGNKLGYTKNSKGYKVIPPYYGLIQGDGIKDEDSIDEIYTALEEKGWSAENLCFGSGGGLLQSHTRDTQRSAQKCSLVTIDGQDVGVYKDPVTDPGKISKFGKLDLIKTSEGFKTVNYDADQESHLKTVWECGKLLIEHNLDDIRKKVDDALLTSL